MDDWFWFMVEILCIYFMLSCVNVCFFNLDIRVDISVFFVFM